MVTGSRTGGNLAAGDNGVGKTVQLLKEIVGDHSDADIYAALEEANMDANETAQKLLNQDPFHQVKRKRDRKKKATTYIGSVGQRNQSENAGQDMNSVPLPDPKFRREGYSQNPAPRNPALRNPVPRSSALRNPAPRHYAPGTKIQFRVVRDKRSNLNADGELKPPLPYSLGSKDEKVVLNANEKSSAGISSVHQSSRAQNLVHASDKLADSRSRHTGDAPSSGSSRKELFEEKRLVVCVYSSSTDPVHIPSPDSRSSSAIGAIKREIRGLGTGRQSSENVKDSSAFIGSVSNSFPRKYSSTQLYRPFSPISKNQLSQPESIRPNASTSRSFLSRQHGNRSGQYGNRMHQQVGGHQKVPQQNKEWKPKSTQKSSLNNPGVIGTPRKSTSPPADNCMNFELEAAKLQDKLSLANVNKNQNVIIAEHIRVPETDSCQLTFGSFGLDVDASQDPVSGFQEVGISEESSAESTSRLPVSVPEASNDDTAGNKPADILDGQVWHSGSDSTASTMSEQQLPEKNEGSGPQHLDAYSDIGLLRGDSTSYTPSETKQHQDPPELHSACDRPTGYEMPCFRAGPDEFIRGQGLPSPQEQALSSHTANSIPASTIAMLQHQAPMAQMYPQVHVSHFSNPMPYRQFLSPVYVPQMPMPGYSGNAAAYPHPSNSNSYLLLPGGSSHLGANGLKYGIQQFKPVPTGSPTGFGNFNNPTGYPINSPGVVGNANGLEDISRIKYKDGNIYVSNPQAETPEMWMQNPRDLPGLQSTPYYNLTGQTPHGAYLPSHAGHASFNAAAARSSHMQFQGHFLPPQPGPVANPHHLGPTIGGSVGVGVAPPASTAQVGTYQQQQLGHMNWPTNF